MLDPLTLGCRSFKNVPTGAISADKMFKNATLFFLEVAFGPPFARVVFVTQKRVKQVKHFTVVAFSRQTHCYTVLPSLICVGFQN